jgi:hypothetical protein
MVRVGDKVEVMVDNLGGTQEKKGAILTVTKAPGYDCRYPDYFATDTTNSTVKDWYFVISDLSNGNLKLLTSSVPINNSATYSVQFKVGDLTEWFDGSQYLIVGDKGPNFTIQLVKVGSYGSSVGIGHILDHPKAKFYAAKLVPQNGTTATNHTTTTMAHQPNYTFKGSPEILRVTVRVNKCECGADKHGFASHSSWCDCYEPTWKNV